MVKKYNLRNQQPDSKFSSVAQLSDSLRPHGLQHTRLPYPSGGKVQPLKDRQEGEREKRHVGNMLATDTSIWITKSVFPNTWKNQAIPKQEEVFHKEEEQKDTEFVMLAYRKSLFIIKAND